jgi:hypothetical protein
MIDRKLRQSGAQASSGGSVRRLGPARTLGSLPDKAERRMIDPQKPAIWIIWANVALTLKREPERPALYPPDFPRPNCKLWVAMPHCTN